MKLPILRGHTGTSRAASMRNALAILTLLGCFALFYPRDALIEGDEAIDHTVKQGLAEVEIKNRAENGPVQFRGKKLKRLQRITSKIPSFAKGQGLILFLHVPKSGGTTIRGNFDNVKGVEYFFGERKRDFRKALPAIADVLANKRNDTVFVEVHAGNCPSLFELRDVLRSWRKTAEKNNVPIFFFTVLRDPLEFAVSYFNFFHVQTSIEHPSFERVNATVDNFWRLTRHNPQCAFLFGGDKALFPTPQIPVPTDCYNAVSKVISETMDWVGTTEDLYYETIQILFNVTNLEPSSFKPFNMALHVKERFELASLNESVVEAVLDRSIHDTALYEKVKIDFA